MAEDLHELSALYALDALVGDDRARFEAHLDECARCREELAGLKETGAALAFAVEGPLPPPALRERILESVRAEPQNVVPLRPRRSFAVSIAAAAAVAASAAAVALGVWAATLHHSLSHDREALSVLGDPAARHIPVSGAKGQLVVTPSGRAALALDLPEPASGKTYEAWVIDPQPHRAAVFNGGTTVLQQRVQPGSVVAVTIEHAGGVDAPTTKPLLSARV